MTPDPDALELVRRQREDAARKRAIESHKAVSYIDDDGCEVTVTELGYVFYNAADWW